MNEFGGNVMSNNIRAIDRVGSGFPPDEGERLAETLISDNRLNWDALDIDLRGCPAGLLISAFFNAFLQKIHEDASEHFEQAKAIKWQTDFPFQEKNVAEWIARFKPQATA